MTHVIWLLVIFLPHGADKRAVFATEAECQHAIIEISANVQTSYLPTMVCVEGKAY